MIRILLFFCLGFVSCTPSNLEDLRCEAKNEIKKLIADLQELETIEEVQISSKRLRKRFNRLGCLLLQTRNFLHAEESYESPLGDQLFRELARIYEIPGARAVIETAQSEAVRRLDRR